MARTTVLCDHGAISLPRVEQLLSDDSVIVVSAKRYCGPSSSHGDNSTVLHMSGYVATGASKMTGSPLDCNSRCTFFGDEKYEYTHFPIPFGLVNIS